MATDKTLRIWRVGPEILDSLADAAMENQLLRWRAMLSIAEQQRADAFQAEEHRRAYIAAHAALRLVLGRLVASEIAGIAPALLRFKAEDGAKPVLLLPEHASAHWSDLHFNLSHTRRAVLIAVAAWEVGVDVEWERPMGDLESMARAVMSDAELRQWQSMAKELQSAAFYRVWTRKEAYLKAIGLGLFRPLQEVTVPVEAGFLLAGREVEDRAGDGVWLVRDVPVWDGFSASVCWQGTDSIELVVEDLTLADLQ